MRAFAKLFQIEGKLSLRCPDSIFFGVIMPSAIFVLIAVLCGSKQAFDGSSYTMLESSFGALITVGICATAFMGIPLTIADYRDKKILKHFFVTPTSPLKLLLTHILLDVLLCCVSAGVICVIAAAIFSYRIHGSVLLFLLSYLFVMAAMYSLGMIMSSLCKNVKVANVVCTIVYFPMLFLSGATIPYELFPAPIKALANVLPLTQGIKLLKQVSIGQVNSDLVLPVIVLTVSIVAGILVTKKAFCWE